MNRLEYEGRFLADIKDYGLFKSNTSQALAVDLIFQTRAYLDGEIQRTYAGYRVRGRFFVIGKAGDVLPEQTAALADATGWDGDLNLIALEMWQPYSPVQVVVEKEKSDKGRTFYNAVRILRETWQPARAGNLHGEEGQRIAEDYSEALKAVVSKFRRQESERPVPQEARIWARENAWATFQANAAGMRPEDVLSVWEEALGYYGDGKEELTAEEWEQVASIDPRTWAPF